MAPESLFPASTGDEQHQFHPESWVPTETVIANRDREQRPFTNFVQLAKEFKREEEGRKNFKCETSKLHRKLKREKVGDER